MSVLWTRRSLLPAGAGLLLAACQRRAEKDPSVLTIARYGEPTSLDPGRTVSADDGTVLGLLYRRLTGLDPKSGLASPDLATKWTEAPDGMSWRFSLASGQVFSDGAPVTAQAVVYSIERVRKVNPAVARMTAFLDGVKALDAQTLQVDLNAPFPPLAEALSLPLFSVVNPAIEAQARDGDAGSQWLSRNGAGGGPYMLSEWRRGELVSLTANPRHVGVLPFKGVQFRVIPDPSAQRLQLQRGDIDLITDVPPRDVQFFAAFPTVSVVRQPNPNQVFFLTLNTERVAEPVRQAIAAAIDYDAIVRDVLMGNASRVAGVIPASMPGFRSEMAMARRDPARARALLAQAPAGWADRPLDFMAFNAGPLVQLIQSNLREVGIETRVTRASPSAVDQRRAGGDFDCFVDGVAADYSDPSVVINVSFSPDGIGRGGLNFSRFADPSISAAMASAAAEREPAARMQAYARVEAAILSRTPVIPLYSSMKVMAMSNRIAAAPLNPHRPSALDVPRFELTKA